MDTVASAAGRSGKHVLPSGDIAFLFTDIVGSTSLWETNPEAMRLDLRRHDALMKDAVAAHNGHVFKTVGDAFYAAFSSARDAVEAAIDAQKALGGEPFLSDGGIAVRMAVHVGEAEERDDDFFGPALNRIARLLSIGHGGQILLSSAAAERAGSELPPEDSLLDLGEHRLKDLTSPEHVFQLLAPHLSTEFPPLRSLSVLDNNLPQQATSLVGRDEDIARIKELVDTSTLVTLSGAGGVGKTRCALQAGAELLDRYADGVWFADLAPVSDQALVASTIGRIFDLPDSPSQPMIETLAGHLKNKRTLLILDNCEHVIGEASKIVSALRRNCQYVHIIATSREALNVSGEALYRMPSLAVPAGDLRKITAGEALRYSAVALFETRGQAVNEAFSVSDDNARAVAEICRRLDGIPLAIELAAARVRVLTAAQLQTKLNERFRVLTGGDRTALPRQQTMLALIDWSYDLLSDREQFVFRQLSIFSGGFTSDAAVGVCESDTLDELDVVDTIASLIDKSLVVTESGPARRYSMLESTRQYARDKLTSLGEVDNAAARHALTYASFAEHLDAQHEELSPREWYAQAEAEIENLRAAVTWSFSDKGEAIVGQRLVVTLARTFGIAAATEGMRWVVSGIERITEETPPFIVAGLYLARATFASVFNQYGTALAAAQQALSIYETLDKPLLCADAQRLAGRSLIYLGRLDEGEKLLQASLATRRAYGSYRIGGILGDLAVARAMQGDLDGARELFGRARAMFEEGADTSKLAITAAALAEAEFLSGDAQAAVRFGEEALAGARQSGRHRTAAAILGNLAGYQLELDRFDEARSAAQEALEISRDLHPDAVSVAFSLQHLAAAAVLRDGPNEKHPDTLMRAARILGFVDGRLTQLEIAREATEQRGYQKTLSVLKAHLQDTELAAAMDAGRSFTEDRAVSESGLLA